MASCDAKPPHTNAQVRGGRDPEAEAEPAATGVFDVEEPEGVPWFGSSVPSEFEPHNLAARRVVVQANT